MKEVMTKRMMDIQRKTLLIVSVGFILGVMIGFGGYSRTGIM
jgi:hypothetical protein